MDLEFVTEEQAAALSAAAPSRQVRRALARRVLKHNRHVEWELEQKVRSHRATARQTSRLRPRPERTQYPAGEDQRHDKYLHSSARIARAMRMALK
jgi:hypothetical protein